MINRLATSRVESYTRPQGHTVQKSGKTITYGPYGDDDGSDEDGKKKGKKSSGNGGEMQPLTYRPLRVHYENNVPFLTTAELRRELWVSHWAGVLAVEEWFHVRHDGARYISLFLVYIFSHIPC